MDNNLGDEMPLKTVSNIIAVWILNGISFLVAFSTHDALEVVQLIKEILAGISFIVALAFTLYKFKQSWKGWNPKSKR